MKELIQQLISEGRTEDALNKLVQASDEGIILLSRYNNGKRQFNMGLIDFGEWSRIQNQINYAVLETANGLKGGGEKGTPASNANTTTDKPAAQARVFISYNHKDEFVMRSIKGALAEKGIQVAVDIKDMEAGESIQSFIEDALFNNDIVLSIVSKNSLLSGWVNRETTVAKVLSKQKKNWIPVSVDDAMFNSAFLFEAYDIIDKKIAELRDHTKRALDTGADISAFTDDLKRQQDLRNSLSSTIGDLKGMLVIDLSDGRFDAGMSKVIDRIHNLTKPAG